MSPLTACLAVPGLAATGARLAASVAVAALLAYGFVLAALAGPATTFIAVADDDRAPEAVGRTESGTVVDSATAIGATDAARALVGRPYVWGGVDPVSGVDCSGLVMWAFRQVGITVPRTAQQQFDATRRVARAELRPGDLVFFSICCQPPDAVTHVGVYLGSARMAHAPAPGEFVRVESIDSPYWRAHWAGAGRVTGTAGLTTAP